MSVNVVDRYGVDLTGSKDNAPNLAAMAAEIAAIWTTKKPMPRYVFPAGDVAFSAWPDLAYDKLQLIADGEVRLRPQDNAPIIFDASLRQPGSGLPTNNLQPQIENFFFKGFDVYAGTAPAAVTFRAVHRSSIQARVFGNATTRVAFQVTFCIITVLELQVGGGVATGVLMNAWPGKPALQPTACTLYPCLESCGLGLDMQSAGSCAVYNGTIESCGTAVFLGDGAGSNTFYSVEMEGNGKDVTHSGGAHGNGFLYCGNNGKLNTDFGLFNSNWARN